MTLPTPNVEHRIAAQGRRITRAEEDIAGMIDTTYAVHRRVLKVELIVTAIAAHLGVPLPTDADVDAALDEQ